MLALCSRRIIQVEQSAWPSDVATSHSEHAWQSLDINGSIAHPTRRIMYTHDVVNRTYFHPRRGFLRKKPFVPGGDIMTSGGWFSHGEHFGAELFFFRGGTLQRNNLAYIHRRSSLATGNISLIFFRVVLLSVIIMASVLWGRLRGWYKGHLHLRIRYLPKQHGRNFNALRRQISDHQSD